MNELLKTIGDFKKKFKTMTARQKAQVYMQGGFVAVVFFVCIGLFMQVKAPVQTESSVTKTKVTANKHKTAPQVESDAMLISDDIDQKSYVAKIENQYYSVSEKNENMEQKISDLSQQVDQLTKSQQSIAGSVALFHNKLNDAVTKIVKSQQQQVPGGVGAANYSLDVTKIAEVNSENRKTVYLPAGSFVRGTLLTGVYAPTVASNPLPVLIRLKEAFFGPNNARIDLSGAFGVGKATGDLTSERALIQITTISAVLPTGQTFEENGNLGYLTDITGQLGLKGIVVRNTGTQLALSFASGFMGGAAQAFANQQTTSSLGSNGEITQTVTGNSGKNAAFSGVAASANKLSEYYNKQLEEIIPAVKVDSGVDVYFVVLKGVKINGLTTDSGNTFNYVD